MNQFITSNMLIAMNGAVNAAGVRDQNILETCVGSWELSQAYEPMPVFAEGIVIASSLVLYHPFVDGNKRTAASAIVTSLAIYGIGVKSAESLAACIAHHAAYGKHWRELFVHVSYLFEASMVHEFLDQYDRGKYNALSYTSVAGAQYPTGMTRS